MTIILPKTVDQRQGIENSNGVSNCHISYDFLYLDLLFKNAYESFSMTNKTM